MSVIRNLEYSGWRKIAAACFLLAFGLVLIASCTPRSAQVAPTAEPSATQPAPEAAAATATEQPSATPTLAPTATLEPSATPTLPPTATAVPPLALATDGFSGWCAPQAYAGVKPAGPDATEYANKLVVMGDVMQVKIPAAFCALAFQFNQAAPAGATLVFYDGSSPFLKLPLNTVDGRPEASWALVSHDYVVNPPYWEVTYKLAVLDPNGKELWSHPVKFAKPLPPNCPYGGLPDPVTLLCAKTDPLEIEPHPDTTYPPYYTRVPPSN